MNRAAFWLAFAALAVSACTKETSHPPPPRDRPLGAQRCSGKPGPKNRVLPVLQRPFDGQYPVYNLVDHDLPLPGEIRAATVADKELTYCGIQALGLAEGYPGYAFGLPAGTPVLAAADGEVIAAGTMPPFACPLTMRLVDDQQAVDLRHDTLGNVGFIIRAPLEGAGETRRQGGGRTAHRPVGAVGLRAQAAALLRSEAAHRHAHRPAHGGRLLRLGRAR
jgi:murein DD-endopeptidase MepM/ murein hydrolase activator NlpD